jgi:hypothetical protein
MHLTVIYAFIHGIHTLNIALHVVVVGRISVFFKMAFNAMSIRDVMGITTAFSTQNLPPGGW